MAKHRRGSIAGAFAWRLIEMIESPAHRALSLSARKILDRLEIELYRHGGKPEQNGLLPCTYDHFVEFGVHRHAIGPGIREVVALGFVEITRKGCAGNAGYRQSTLYRLTYRHAGSDKRTTDDWRRIETLAEAEAIAEAARTARPEQRSKNKSPVSKTITGASVGKRTNRGHSPVPETITTVAVPETITTSISRRGAPQHRDRLRMPDDWADEGLRSRVRRRRSGTLSFERWGGPRSDPGMAPRPRRAGTLSSGRRRAETKPISVTLAVEALPPAEGLPSNAKNNVAAPLTHDVAVQTHASALVH
jgi:hypothetical protein